MKNKKQLDKIRNDIDNIDLQLVYLLGKRFSLARKAGAVKKTNGSEIRDLKRESEVENSVQKYSLFGEKINSIIWWIYTVIILESRNLQNQLPSD